ncbi:Thioesterase/thiol ester dehydrase-isomerase [Eremomyces bilateralis CBS 781.70]|uniref:Thioesterase/thiol ester dehydrase-isomerase n=1 Tax=Eremomyces bilateralis CBS 781.70 TaxID=1392243 RepID=A0A6G1G148_9PEZI|nr:Thioesterase/thiol ester dehydrase-isomerase [Eremomyces bilateralis CBS 781.70]KAF1811837.1 Thioesterase/thiol ester dehydrase-isomerase [Eremomyces bilateralis CBS 781.70]
MSTLIKPPPVDVEKSRIENVLELTQLTPIDPDLYTNTRPLWHPPGARGIYGGAVIAQCLAAAQKTVPPDFYIHSMHCYFVLAGNSNIPIIYHVEHVREGRSFCTRTVQARQNAKPIFTTTMSFAREGSGGKNVVKHEQNMPTDIAEMGPPPDDHQGDETGGGEQSPFVSQRLRILNKESNPHEKKVRQWIKARGKISPKGGHEAHLSALAYMSDSYFIGTIARVHNLWRFAPGRERKQPPSIDEETLRKLLAADEETIEKVKNMPGVNAKVLESLQKPREKRPEVGMMVSLDHTIYFHRPRDFMADDWILAEMESPWAGDGRGLVLQKMYTKDGKLIATCVQEGVVRLRPDSESKL